MFKKLVQSVSRLTRICKRKCSICVPESNTKICALHNGVRIVTEENNSPLACVALFVITGSRYETSCNHGLTHFIEHMAYKGFKTIKKDKLDESMISTAGRLTVRTTREIQIFSAILPSDYAHTAVDKLAKIIYDLDLSEQEIEKERYNMYLELKDSDVNPKRLVFDYLHATAFQGTPLALSVIGPSENIERFEPISTASFISEHYQPYRLILVTSGKVAHDKITSTAETRLGGIAPQPNCEPDPGPNRFTGSSVVYRDDSMPLAHVAIAFEAPGYSSPEYLPMLLAKHIVGSWDKSQGLGAGNAPMVARGVALDKSCERYESFYITYQDVGLWGVYFVADKWRLDEIVSRVQDQWMHLCSTVQYTDIQRAKNALRLELARRCDGVVRSAQDIGFQLAYTNRRKRPEDFEVLLDVMKVPYVREVCDKYLYDRCPAVAAVGPTETLSDYCRIRDGQWWLRL